MAFILLSFQGTIEKKYCSWTKRMFLSKKYFSQGRVTLDPNSQQKDVLISCLDGYYRQRNRQTSYQIGEQINKKCMDIVDR